MRLHALNPLCVRNLGHKFEYRNMNSPFSLEHDMWEEITFHPDIIFVKNIETVFQVWKCLELIWGEFV